MVASSEYGNSAADSGHCENRNNGGDLYGEQGNHEALLPFKNIPEAPRAGFEVELALFHHTSSMPGQKRSIKPKVPFNRPACP